MKNVLLLVHDDAGQEARFQTALDLTRALEGHLTCVDVAVFPHIVGDSFAVSVEAALFADEQGREESNRKRLEARLAHEDVPWTWVDMTGGMAEALKLKAKLADVIVVSRRLHETLPDMRAIASEVVIGSGKTVVAVPDDVRTFRTDGHAMIAWDGSSEAIDALQAAVPLLALARIVTLVEVKDGSVELPAEDAASYLSRHGIKPVVVRRKAQGEPTADVLIAEAINEGADYVIMGGFGRSRMAEAVFGGVSREMLTDSPIPVVMAH